MSATAAASASSAQRCEECNLFARRIGTGGPYPHCDEPVAIVKLIEVST